MEKYGLILAGGSGTRLWPISRKGQPKQFLNLYNDNSMIEETVKRISKIIPQKNIFIVTEKKLKLKMRKSIGHIIDDEHIILEPEARGTAACIGYAAMMIQEYYGDGLMLVFSCDHYIGDDQLFKETILKAALLAERDNNLLLIGIKPKYPETRFGYIELMDNSISTVKRFVEKPTLSVAKEYIDSGKFLWNSGMYIWKISTVLNNFKDHAPDIYDKLLKIKNSKFNKRIINEIYPTIIKTTIDYAIMETAQNVKVVAGNFEWFDIGTLDSLEFIIKKDKKGNTSFGKNLSINSENCLTYSNKNLIVTYGLNNVAVIENDGVILVCNKDYIKDTAIILDELKKSSMNKYL